MCFALGGCVHRCSIQYIPQKKYHIVFFRTCCTLSGGLQFVECEAIYCFIYGKSRAHGFMRPFFVGD